MQKFIKQIQVMGKPIAMQLLLGLIGIPVGIIIGAMDTAFGKILLEITGIREFILYISSRFTACRYFNCILLSKVWRNQQ
ncbi:MAG: hypothetical protein ACLR13_09100 [Acutalibacteraceae bacterium]